MKTIFALLIAALTGLASLQPASAEEVVTDYQGNTVRLQEGDVRSNGINIHYYTVGAGPLVFISHGHTAFWFDWRNQISALSKKFKVVIYDVRNHNKSGAISGVENNTNTKLQEDLLALQNHFTDGPAIYLGHDLGGMVLWGYAMDHPDKVKLLMIENAIHPRAFIRDLAHSPAQQQASIYIQSMHDDPKAAAERAKGNFSPDNPRRTFKTPEARKLWTDAFNHTSDTAFQGNIDWYCANFPKKPYTADAVGFGHQDADFPHVKAPTLLIHALDDTALMPGGVDGLGQWIDNGFTLTTLPSGGHNILSDAPGVINTILLNWLGTHASN